MTNEVATTILNQLGGNRFIRMTGTRNFVGSSDKLTFKLPRTSKGVSHVRITLTPDDLYRVEFLKWNARHLTTATVSEHDGIYAEDLCEIFEKETGLLTRL